MDVKNKISSWVKRNDYEFKLIVILAVWLIFMAITKFDKFYTILNFQTMLAQFPEYGLIALGVMVCMITGGIDLATVGVANVTAICSAMFMISVAKGEDSISVVMVLVCFGLAVIVGGLAGAFNGLLITKFKIPPILATLGSGQLFTGIGIVMTNGSAISNFPNTFSYNVNARILGIPVQFLIFVIIAAIIGFMMSKTSYGKKITLIGSGQKIALYSGLKVDAILIKTYVISGICAAMGGLVMLANYNSARADYGAVYTLQSILIVVLGGVSPNGGKGKISGVIVAILLVRALETGINRFPQISSYYISLIWGAVLILAMVLTYFVENDVKFLKGKKVK